MPAGWQHRNRLPTLTLYGQRLSPARHQHEICRVIDGAGAPQTRIPFSSRPPEPLRAHQPPDIDMPKAPEGSRPDGCPCVIQLSRNHRDNESVGPIFGVPCHRFQCPAPRGLDFQLPSIRSTMLNSRSKPYTAPLVSSVSSRGTSVDEPSLGFSTETTTGEGEIGPLPCC